MTVTPDEPVQITEADPEEDYAPEDIPVLPVEDTVPENDIHPEAL